MLTITIQAITSRLVISSLSRFTPSSWDMWLCRSFMGNSFGTAFERICRRCFFLQDLRWRSIPPTVALRGARSFFVTLDPWKSLLGFKEPKIRKTPSLSSLPRNDHKISSTRWSHHAAGKRVLAIHLLGFCGPPLSECGRLFVRCGRLDDSPPHLWHYINRRSLFIAPIHCYCPILLPKIWP
jgi:hypothetical protein